MTNGCSIVYDPFSDDNTHMMICFNCSKSTEVNAMNDLEEIQFDRVVEYYCLIHLQGPDEMFDENDAVVLCSDCVKKGVQG